MRQITFEGHKYDNLTRKYYARQMCARFSQLEALDRWKEHLATPEEVFQQTSSTNPFKNRKLEDGAIIITQTLAHPKLDAAQVHRELDAIATLAHHRMGNELNP